MAQTGTSRRACGRRLHVGFLNSTRFQPYSGGVGVPRVDDRYFGSVKASTAAAGNPRMTRRAFGAENSCRRTATTVPWVDGDLGGGR